MVIVGGGYIACEQACIFHSLGVETHFVFRQVHPAPQPALYRPPMYTLSALPSLHMQHMHYSVQWTFLTPAVHAMFLS